MGKLRHQQAPRLQDVSGSCVILLHPKSPLFFPQSHQDCEDTGVCPSSQPAGSKSEDAAAIRVLGDREGSWQLSWLIAAAWLTETGLSDQPAKQSLAECVLHHQSSTGPTNFSATRQVWKKLLPLGQGCSHWGN